MANETVFDVQPFVAALERASAEVLAAVRQAAIDEAQGLASRVRSAYPQGTTGNLRAGVTWGANSPGRGLGAWVRSNAPHVHFLEAGTAVRRNATRKNANRGRILGPGKGGSQIFVPLAIPARQRFYARVQAILDRPREVR